MFSGTYYPFRSNKNRACLLRRQPTVTVCWSLNRTSLGWQTGPRTWNCTLHFWQHENSTNTTKRNFLFCWLQYYIEAYLFKQRMRKNKKKSNRKTQLRVKTIYLYGRICQILQIRFRYFSFVARDHTGNIWSLFVRNTPLPWRISRQDFQWIIAKAKMFEQV